MTNDLYTFIEEGLTEWKFLKENDFKEFIAKLVLATLKNQDEFKKEAEEILIKPKCSIEAEVKAMIECCEPINGSKIRLLCANLILETLNNSDIIEEAKSIKEKCQF